MNAWKFTLSATAALVLTACIGGGSNGGIGPHSGATPTVNPPSNPPTDGIPKTDNNINTDSHTGTGGKLIEIDNGTDKTVPQYKYTGHFSSSNTKLQGKSGKLAHNDMNTLLVDGVEIKLPAWKPEGGEDPFVTEYEKGMHLAAAVTTYLYAGKNLDYAVYGFLDRHPDVKDEHLAFVQGKESQNIPSSGRASYQGYAVYRPGLRRARSDYVVSGEAVRKPVHLDVDFGAKKLSGRVDSYKKIPLEADIKGSKFEGVRPDGWETKGAFYGPDAAEVAGTFRNLKKDSSALGAFGAKKDKNYTNHKYYFQPATPN